jgi:hypothetical protein
MVWEVLWAVGFQDDGAVTHSWLWTDPDVADQDVCSMGAAGALHPLFLGAQTEKGNPFTFMGPPVLTYNRYLTYRFVASAAAKNGCVRAIVKELRGVAMEA